MPNIFISYRRSDTAEISFKIYNALIEKFGHDQVFIDRESLPLGEHFPAYLAQRMAWADIILVVMGKTWLSCTDDHTGRPRIQNMHDYVRQEVEMALFRAQYQGVSLIPVSIDEAVIPKNGADIKNVRFPGKLEELKQYHGKNINSHSFREGIDELIQGIGKAIPTLELSRTGRLYKPQILSHGIDPLQKDNKYGGLIHENYHIPSDAKIFLHNRGNWKDNSWEISIECESSPYYNNSRSSHETSFLNGMCLQEVVGAVIEWYQIDPKQCFYQRKVYKDGRSFLEKVSGGNRYEWIWTSFNGQPVYTDLHLLLKNFYYEIIQYGANYCDYIQESFKPVHPNYSVYGYLTDQENRTFGEYICSLTISLGGKDYNTGQLFYCPTVPDTKLQYVHVSKPPFITNIRYCGHVGKDEKGYHIAYVRY